MKPTHTYLHHKSDVQGNDHLQAGSFTTTSGETRAVEDVWFQVDNTYTLPAEWLDVSADIAILPDLAGYGTVHSLHQAMNDSIWEAAA